MDRFGLAEGTLRLETAALLKRGRLPRRLLSIKRRGCVSASIAPTLCRLANATGFY